MLIWQGLQPFAILQPQHTKKRMKLWAINQVNGTTAEILMYGYIGSEEVNANDFTQALKKLEATCTLINLRINSGGGSIFEGLAIFNAIKNCKCDVDAYIDGLAASMASVIPLACRKIYMSKMAMLMTHRPSGAVMGNPDQLRSHADMLEQLEQTVTNIYAERTGLSIEDVKTKYLGAADNWLNATQALDAKIIDGIYDGPAKKNITVPVAMRNEKDLINLFTNYLTETNMKQFMLTAEAMAVLSLTADADATAVNDAIAKLAAKASNADALKTQLDTVSQKLQTVQADAVNAKAEGLIDGAIGAGKIPAGDKEKYVKLAKADFESTKEVVDGMKAYTSIQQQMNNEGNDAVKSARLAELIKMSGQELYMKGHFEELKVLSMDVFKAKYKEYFGGDYPATK